MQGKICVQVIMEPSFVRLGLGTKWFNNFENWFRILKTKKATYVCFRISLLYNAIFVFKILYSHHIVNYLPYLIK